MPMYEYRCLECGEVFDRAEHIDDHQTTHPKCPRCESERVEQVFTAFFAKTARKS